MVKRSGWEQRVDGYVVIGSALVGVLVGLTGAGGGALMTPMLILLFSVKPSAAISSDLVAAVVMRPVGAAVHFQRRTVNLGLAAWMTAGSVPAAFGGAYLLHRLGESAAAATDVERALGAALLLGAAGTAARLVLDRRSSTPRDGSVRTLHVRPFPTVAIGVLGGFVVGMTSVGAGSLMIVLLLFLYPTIGAKALVGTDLAQALPLTASAALGALAFGHVEVPLTMSIVAGAVPAVLAGSLLSSRIPDGLLRPLIFCVILASGLKYVGVGSVPLAFCLAAAVLAMAGALLRDRRRAGRAPADPVPTAGIEAPPAGLEASIGAPG